MGHLVAKDLGKEYINEGVVTRVLQGVSLTLNSGDNLCLYGPSGAGKSTLLYLLGGLEKPTNGEVLLDGENIQTMDDSRQAIFRNTKMGFIFQFHHLLPDFSALENVMMPALINGESRRIAKEAAGALLNQVGLSHRLNHRPQQLSGGEQQRVAVARALVMDPHFVFADEPTGNLDNENSSKIFDLLLKLNSELRATLIVVTHNEPMSRLFNKKIKILDGRIEH